MREADAAVAVTAQRGEHVTRPQGMVPGSRAVVATPASARASFGPARAGAGSCPPACLQCRP